MNYCIDQALMPYVAATHTRLGRNFPVSPILDSLKTHFTPHARDIFEQERVTVIPLPPHASHLYQILDFCIFGVMKKEYKYSGNCKTSRSLEEKLAQKIERVVQAWHRACFIGTVLAVWRSASFVHEWNDGALQKIRINPTLLMSKQST
jgi:hypothetical protein